MFSSDMYVLLPALSALRNFSSTPSPPSSYIYYAMYDYDSTFNLTIVYIWEAKELIFTLGSLYC